MSNVDSLEHECHASVEVIFMHACDLVSHAFIQI